MWTLTDARESKGSNKRWKKIDALGMRIIKDQWGEKKEAALLKTKTKTIQSHLGQVKLVIVPGVVLAFIRVARGNDDVHSDHAQNEHVKHGGPH